MLYELYTSLTTRCPQYIRHMDYLYEIIAMRSRYQRNREAWRPHLENTRQAVLSAAEQCGNRNRAVLLGAGLLLDVPLVELSTMFQEVVLLDIVFLPEVRRRIRPYGNVRLVEHDVTNMGLMLHRAIRQGNHELPEAAPRVPDIDDNTCLVVSLNILSQLWVLPRAYALKKMRGLSVERVDDWCGQIVKSHYQFLRSLPCSVCLIADYEFIKRDKSGSIVSRDSTIAGLELPERGASWTWSIIPPGEERFISKELSVGVWNVRAE